MSNVKSGLYNIHYVLKTNISMIEMNIYVKYNAILQTQNPIQ